MNLKKTFSVSAALLLSMTVSGNFAQGAIIDDFDTAGLGEYTFSKILDQGTATNVTFSDASGTIDVTSAGADGAEQVLLLRGDVTLAQNDEIILDAPTSFISRDFGIAVGQAHPDLGDGNAGDNRNAGDYAFMAWRSASQLNSRGFDGGSEIALGQEFGVNATALFISRLGNDDIEMGWYDGAVRNVHRTLTPSTTDIFSNIGFYADLRADGDGFAGADNLRFIPEPATMALAGFSLASLLTLRRRS